MNEHDQLIPTLDLKTCCANLYESDWARLLLGDSFHPGGLALTERLGQLLDLQPGRRVLDVAAGRGASAIFLARHFGCEVVGVDYGPESVSAATVQAQAAGLGDRVPFVQGDAEQLRFADATFDAVICECAFCTLPDKTSAAAEFARVLRPDGRLGLSDLTRTGPLPPELDGLLAWIACIADARPVAEYVAYLAQAGFEIDQIEPHDQTLETLVKNTRTKLLGAELLVKLNKLELPSGIDLAEAKTLARDAAEAVRAGKLGYAVLIGTKGVGDW
ncbi:MAG TPA: methyltransferase domain-containing protein [Anaerolineae bacterium]